MQAVPSIRVMAMDRLYYMSVFTPVARRQTHNPSPNPTLVNGIRRFATSWKHAQAIKNRVAGISNSSRKHQVLV
jgi:hypothetical protein